MSQYLKIRILQKYLHVMNIFLKIAPLLQAWIRLENAGKTARGRQKTKLWLAGKYALANLQQLIHLFIWRIEDCLSNKAKHTAYCTR